jgi:hypothetical protein
VSGYVEGDEFEPPRLKKAIFPPQPPAPPTGRARPRDITIWLEVPDAELQVKRMFYRPMDVPAYLETLKTDWAACVAQATNTEADEQLRPFVWFEITIWVERDGLEIQRNKTTMNLDEAVAFVRDVFELWEKVSG